MSGNNPPIALPPPPPEGPRWSRLSGAQLRNTLGDLFGADLSIGALDPDLEVQNFAALGAARVTTSEQGVERYTNVAFDVAAQVMKTPARRSRWVTCTPTVSAVRACAEETFRRLGRLLFRRPVDAATLTGIVSVVETVTTSTNDAWTGFEHGLAALLQSPRFLYAADIAATAPATAKSVRLDPYALATRLALVLTNSNPDEALLDAAAAGELATKDGIGRQVDRITKLPTFRRAFRSFFGSMWDIEKVKTRTFASDLPKLTPTLATSMLEETMRFLEHHLLDQGRSYREALRSRETFINAELAALYGVPAPASGFAPITLPASSNRFGLFTQAALLAASSKPRDSSPMLRGRMIQRDFLCRTIPDPPPDLMAVLPESSEDSPTTKRQRLQVHREIEGCASCHDLIDPPGLALENYDALGGHRTKEHGLTIDATGSLDGVAFDGPAGFVAALADGPAVTRCLVTKLLRFATGRVDDASESARVTALEKTFTAQGERFVPLLVEIVTSETFTHVSTSKP